MKKHFLFLIAFFICANFTFAQQKNHDELRSKLKAITSKYKATVGLSVIELETNDSLSINNQILFPMQSVFKFPLSLTVLHLAEAGKISLNQKVFISKKMLDNFSFSPLKNRNKGDSLWMSVDSLMMYAISYSDNLATDVLFETIGGTKVANDFIHKIGFKNIQIKKTELEIGGSMELMYENNSSPYDISRLLKKFYEGKIVNENSKQKLLHYMIVNFSSDKRLKGYLQSNVVVAHKTGTSPFNDTLKNICNDVGIIYLPNGNHLAVSVFVINSRENYEATEKIIATLTKEIFDFYNK
jgi:beta-lactamase class A